MAVKALRTAKGAAALRKRLMNGEIKVVGGLSGGTGGAGSSVYTVVSPPRKKSPQKVNSCESDTSCAALIAYEVK
jgi:hypothetical protein